MKSSPEPLEGYAVQEQKHLPVSGPRHPILPVSGSSAVINYLQLPTLLLEPLESSGVTQGKEKGCQGSKGGNQKETEPGFPGMGTFMELVTTVGLMSFFPWLTILMSLLALLNKDALKQTCKQQILWSVGVFSSPCPSFPGPPLNVCIL